MKIWNFLFNRWTKWTIDGENLPYVRSDFNIIFGERKTNVLVDRLKKQIIIQEKLNIKLYRNNGWTCFKIG